MNVEAESAKKEDDLEKLGRKNNAFFPSNTGATRLQLNCSVQDTDWSELSVSGGEELRLAEAVAEGSISLSIQAISNSRGSEML
jgi:hypothetical protein